MSENMKPAEQRAFAEGVIARRSGLSRDENPYHAATNAQARKCWAWYRGYDEQTKKSQIEDGEP